MSRPGLTALLFFAIERDMDFQFVRLSVCQREDYAMPRRLLCAILALLAALAFQLPSTAFQAEEAAPLTLLTFHRPPYYILENGRAAGGFLLEAAQTVFERADLPVAVREMPPGRIVATLADNKIQACAVGWIKTPERESFARFSRPLYRSQPMAVALSGDRPAATGPPPTLAVLLGMGLTWGLREGFSYGKGFDQAFLKYPADRVKRFSDTPHMVELLAKGRLDAMLVDPEELAWIVAGHPELGPRIRLVALADASPGADRHIMCSQSVAPDTMARLDAAIRDFAATDQYRKLTTFAFP